MTDVAKCKYYNNGWCLLSESCDQIKYRSCGDMTLFDCHYRNWQRKEQECEELKAEIKLSKEMLIQNTSETNKYTIPQIIEQFISDNYINQQNEDGYTIPIFLQLEDILYEKENLEEKLGFAETTKGLQRAEINKLKQTLTEIKEIAEFSDRPYKHCGEYNDCCEIVAKILSKISEVKE